MTSAARATNTTVSIKNTSEKLITLACWRTIAVNCFNAINCASGGFDAASMMDIAKAAGVSKGTLYVYFTDKYVYFTDKDELFAAIVRGECSVRARHR